MEKNCSYEGLGILQSGIRATLNFRKVKVALNPLHKYFLTFSRHPIVLNQNWKILKKWLLPSSFLSYNRLLKDIINGVFNRLYCCYGNLLYKTNDCNLFTNDCVFVWFQYYSITCQFKESLLEKYWKLFPAPLTDPSQPLLF